YWSLRVAIWLYSNGRESRTKVHYRVRIPTSHPNGQTLPPLAMDVVSGEGDRGQRISALRGEFAQEKLVSFFKTPEELAGLVGSAVHLWEKSRTASYTSEDIPLANKEQQEERERKTQLRALIADHSGFMRDRLESFVGREKEVTEIQQRIDEKQQTGGY